MGGEIVLSVRSMSAKLKDGGSLLYMKDWNVKYYIHLSCNVKIPTREQVFAVVKI